MITTCQHEGCTTKVTVYRQCSEKTCQLEIGYCTQHGGDDRSTYSMAAHIEHAHRDKEAV